MALVPTNILGYTTTTDTSFAAIRGSTYTEQSTNAQRSLVSSSASDASAGTGARSIRVTYYDQTLAGPFTEDVVLAGTTPVNTVASNICFIGGIEVLTVGSAGGNVGVISLKAATGGGGVTVGSINAGDNQTQWCHHYVPIAATAQIHDLGGAIKGGYAGEIHMRKATPTVANTPETTIAPILRIAPGGRERILFPVPIVIFGPARIVLYAKSVFAASMDWQAGFGLYES